MEQIGNTLKQIGYSVEQKMATQYVTKDVHDIALNRDKAHHVDTSCTYDVIPKREYGLLLRKMESWNISAPKAIIKKYGVFIVKRAVEYTDATPNVRNKAGYMTYMCGQFKKDAANHVPQEVTEKNLATTEENSAIENPKPQSILSGVKSKKGIFTDFFSDYTTENICRCIT